MAAGTTSDTHWQILRIAIKSISSDLAARVVRTQMRSYSFFGEEINWKAARCTNDWRDNVGSEAEKSGGGEIELKFSFQVCGKPGEENIKPPII